MQLATLIHKKTIMALLAAAVLAVAAFSGSVTPANALVFAPGDAVLVIYGNSNEGYMKLGNFNNLVANGGSVNVSSILNTGGVSGTNPIQYTVVGNNGLTPMWFGSNVDIGQWTTTQKNQVLPTPYNTALINWAGVLGAENNPSQQIYSAASTDSFTHYLNPTGSNTLSGTLPSTRPGFSQIDNPLFLLERTGAASTLAGVATAMLSSQTGLFTVGAVPIPAAAVLFATGLIGLVGVARRLKEQPI